VFEVPEMGFYVVSRYDDVMEVLRDDVTYSSSVGHKMGRVLSQSPRESVNAVLAEGYPTSTRCRSSTPPSTPASAHW